MNTIKYHQLASLIALDTAVIISWIAYHKYQPKLLELFGFQGFKFELALLQGVVLVLTPPIAGLITDYYRKKGDNQLAVFMVGISLTAMVFMAVAFTIFQNPTGDWRYILPILIIIWLISMNIFHSPAVSMIELFVPVHQLPQAMAFFVVAGDITRSIEPSIVALIDLMGAPFTFVFGGVLISITGYVFYRNTQKIKLAAQEERIQDKGITHSNFVVVSVLGLGLGVANAVFFNLFPDIMELKISFLTSDGFRGTYFTSLLIVLAAVLSYPVGLWIQERNLTQILIIGYIGIFVLCVTIFTISVSEVVLVSAILFPLFFAIISVGALPNAFRFLSPRHKVLGVGLFFAGIELANNIFEIFQIS